MNNNNDRTNTYYSMLDFPMPVLIPRFTHTHTQPHHSPQIDGVSVVLARCWISCNSKRELPNGSGNVQTFKCDGEEEARNTCRNQMRFE